LVEYYPFAEEVRCNDTGASFTEVVVEETLEEIGGRKSHQQGIWKVTKRFIFLPFRYESPFLKP
jgi:hypothetical protein